MSTVFIIISILFCCILCGNHGFSEITRRQRKARSSHLRTSSKYMDIYTNHEDWGEVLENYNANVKKPAESYDPINHPFVLVSSVDNINERTDPVPTKLHRVSDRYGDTLESDFGIFTNEGYANRAPLHLNPHRDERKKFVQLNAMFTTNTSQTKPKFWNLQNNGTNNHEGYGGYTYIQKIPNKHQNGSSTHEKVTKEKVNDLLKQYMRKLYLQKYSSRLNDSRRQHIKHVDTGEGKIFGEALEALKNKTIKIAHKFLSLFQVVQFTNSMCTASSGTNVYQGTCFHQEECQNRNGTMMGNCAEGYGVCCIFRYSCGATSRQNCSYFESPGYPDYSPSESSTLAPTTAAPTTMNPSPTPDPRLHNYFGSMWSKQGDSTMDSLACSFNIYRTSNSVQQMRIDFEDLELTGPTNGTCLNERLVISGQNINDQVPVICGYNTGQHVYVDVSMLTGPLQLSVLSRMVSRKRYKFRICQLAQGCSNQMNCLQWYTGLSGVISSFNYDQAAMFNRSTPGYFNNLNYAICIRKEAGYCSITYSNVQNDREYPFELVNLEENGASTVHVGQGGVEIFECPADYIVIDGIRLCGYKLNDGTIIDDFTINAPVRDTSAGPIIIPVRTNQNVTGRGFKLFYTQNVCPSVLSRYR